MSEHKNNKAAIPQIQLSFKNPLEISVYMILDRLTSDSMLCENHLAFLAKSGLPVDPDLIKAVAELKERSIITRDNYYKSLHSGLVVPYTPHL